MAILFFMKKSSVIIIGAGAAGLLAAKELSPLFNVTLLEATAQAGGRIQSLLLHGDIIEAGAEFVHGDLPVTLGLLKDAGIAYIKCEGEMYRKQNGRFVEAGEIAPGWDELLEQMKNIEEDITLHQLLEKFYPGAANEKFSHQIQSYAEGFDVADITKVSVKALYKEWAAEGENNYRISKGYGALVGYLVQQAGAAGVVLHTSCPVKKVNWQKGSVTVQVANGEKYYADKLLVAVPVSVLQQPSAVAGIQFTPSIHFDASTANAIGFGAVIKVVVKFKKAFWQRDAKFIFSDEVFPTWWTQLPDEAPLLTGWLGGPKAHALSNQSDNDIGDIALTSLAAIFDQPIAMLRQSIVHMNVFNWQKNPYAMGAYSYATVETAAAKKVITAPLADTIFFAGEALYTGDHPGTVEAALVSALDAVAAMKKFL